MKVLHFSNTSIISLKGYCYRQIAVYAVMLAACLSAYSSGNNPTFIENLGQWEAQVQFKLELSSGALFLEKDRFTYNLLHPEDLEKTRHPYHNDKKQHAHADDMKVRGHAFQVRFLNSNKHAQTVGSGPSDDYHNYFLGNDPSRWATYVYAYEQVRYANLYDGIDLIIYGKDGNLKYDFIVSQGSNPNAVKLMYDGVDDLVLEDGNLRVVNTAGDIVEQKPYAYQVIDGRKIEVACSYNIQGEVVSFVFPNGYNPNHALIIDPILRFSTYSGSTADNWGSTATYDAQGNLYGGGIAFGTGYPTTNGAYQTTFAGGSTDIAITKFNSTGSALIYSTYVGGSENEFPQSLMVTPAGDLLIYGTTGSANYPVTSNAYDNTFNGGVFVSFNGVSFTNGSDIVVTKLDAAGAALVGSTFMGGTGNDGINGSITLSYNYGDEARGEIITDANGNAYIASTTVSNDFPTTGGVFQPNSQGLQDGCVFMLNSNLSALNWCTYLGGTGDDAAYSLKLDPNGNLYVCGGTASANFPATGGSLNSTYMGGNVDGYLAHLSTGGTSILECTFIGTNQYDQTYFLDIDQDGDIYTVGQTQGAYPVTGNVYSNANGKQFVQKLSPDLSTSIYSTVFGSGGAFPDISPSAFMVDICENVYVSGWGGNVNSQGSTQNLPVTNNAYQLTTDGSDFYFIVFDLDATSLRYATYFGASFGTGEHVDGGTSRFDNNGTIYQAVCAGCGGSSAFPTTNGAWSNTNNSFNCNLGAIKFEFDLLGVVSAASTDTLGCTPFTVTFQNNSQSANNYIWDFGDGSQTDTAFQPTHTYFNSGTYTIMLIAIDSGSCNFADTFYMQIIVNAPDSIVADFTVNAITDCDSLFVICTNTSFGNSLTYTWDMGDGNNYTSTDVNHSYQDTGQYTITLVIYDSLCDQYDTTFQIVDMYNPYPPVQAIFTINQNPCEFLVTTNDSSIGGNLVYNWDFAGTNYNTQNVAHQFTSSGTYTITLILTDTICDKSDTAVITIVIDLDLPVDIGPDWNYCPGETIDITLDVGLSNLTYQWSTSETSQTINVVQTGTYWVQVDDKDCHGSDTVHVRYVEPLYVHGDSTEICVGDQITIHPGTVASSYLWSTGSTKPTITVDKEGVYWFVVTDKYGCEYSDTVYVTENESSSAMWFPNTFTPNGDGLNEVFRPVGYGLDEYEMYIFDRWGIIIYHTDDYDNKPWDGTVEGTGRIVKNGVYVYKVIYSSDCIGGMRRERVGHVTVVR